MLDALLNLVIGVTAGAAVAVTADAVTKEITGKHILEHVYAWWNELREKIQTWVHEYKKKNPDKNVEIFLTCIHKTDNAAQWLYRTVARTKDKRTNRLEKDEIIDQRELDHNEVEEQFPDLQHNDEALVYNSDESEILIANDDNLVFAMDESGVSANPWEWAIDPGFFSTDIQLTNKMDFPFTNVRFDIIFHDNERTRLSLTADIIYPGQTYTWKGVCSVNTDEGEATLECDQSRETDDCGNTTAANADEVDGLWCLERIQEWLDIQPDLAMELEGIYERLIDQNPEDHSTDKLVAIQIFGRTKSGREIPVFELEIDFAKAQKAFPDLLRKNEELIHDHEDIFMELHYPGWMFTISDIIAEVIGLEEGQLDWDGNFSTVYNIAGRKLYQIVEKLENAFELSIPDQDLNSLSSCNSTIHYIADRKLTAVGIRDQKV